jgi:hypothetical protein
MHIRNLVAVSSALLLFATLAFIAVTLSSGPARPAVPVQRSGTAAGFPHRTSAAADLGWVEGDGRVVSAAAAASRLPGPVAKDITSTRRVPGTVGPAVKPKPLKFPVQGQTPEALQVLPAPAAPAVQGYKPADQH